MMISSGADSVDIHRSPPVGRTWRRAERLHAKREDHRLRGGPSLTCRRQVDRVAFVADAWLPELLEPLLLRRDCLRRLKPQSRPLALLVLLAELRLDAVDAGLGRETRVHCLARLHRRAVLGERDDPARRAAIGGDCRGGAAIEAQHDGHHSPREAWRPGKGQLAGKHDPVVRVRSRLERRVRRDVLCVDDGHRAPSAPIKVLLPERPKRQSAAADERVAHRVDGLIRGARARISDGDEI